MGIFLVIWPILGQLFLGQTVLEESFRPLTDPEPSFLGAKSCQTLAPRRPAFFLPGLNQSKFLLAKGENFAADYEVLMAARPNPYNRGNCFQWKKCLGETIGNMWIDSPEFCGPLGGKSWKGRDGKCLDLLETPWSNDPRSLPPADRP